MTKLRPLVGKAHPITEVVLIPSGNGRFEVTLDDELVHSKAATGEHTTNERIINIVQMRLK